MTTLLRIAYVVATIVTALATRPAPAIAGGPPYLTDDPVPVDLGHFETYVFSQWQNEPGTNSVTTGPAVEFNWGFMPALQVHVVAPLANVTMPGVANQHGFGDMEIGIKYRFLTETPNRPQVGIFPMAEVATGEASRGLGNGQTWYRLPLWMQKSWDDGKWTVDAGGGVAIDHAAGQRSYGFGGLLLLRSLGSGLTAGVEAFRQGATAIGATPTTFYNLGASINPSSQFSVLVSLGHSLSGQSQAIGYVGLYYTYPKPAGP